MSTFYFDDSGKMVGIFEEIKPKMNSASQNQQRISREFWKCSGKIRNFVSFQKFELLWKWPKNTPIILSCKCIWANSKKQLVDGARQRFSKFSVSKSNFLNIPKIVTFRLGNSGKMVGIFEEIRQK